MKPYGNTSYENRRGTNTVHKGNRGYRVHRVHIRRARKAARRWSLD